MKSYLSVFLFSIQIHLTAQIDTLLTPVEIESMNNFIDKSIDKILSDKVFFSSILTENKYQLSLWLSHSIFNDIKPEIINALPNKKDKRTVSKIELKIDEFDFDFLSQQLSSFHSKKGHVILADQDFIFDIMSFQFASLYKTDLNLEMPNFLIPYTGSRLIFPERMADEIVGFETKYDIILENHETLLKLGLGFFTNIVFCYLHEIYHIMHTETDQRLSDESELNADKFALDMISKILTSSELFQTNIPNQSVELGKGQMLLNENNLIPTFLLSIGNVFEYLEAEYFYNMSKYEDHLILTYKRKQQFLNYVSELFGCGENSDNLYICTQILRKSRESGIKEISDYAELINQIIYKASIDTLLLDVFEEILPQNPSGAAWFHGNYLLEQKNYDRALISFALGSIHEKGIPMTQEVCSYFAALLLERKGDYIQALNSMYYSSIISQFMPRKFYTKNIERLKKMKSKN